jgi:serine/threonine-protein kinase HipA
LVHPALPVWLSGCAPSRFSRLGHPVSIRCACDRMALNYARTRKFADIAKDKLTYLAAKAKLPEKLVLDTAMQTVDRFHSTWQRRKKDLGLSPDTIEKIEVHIKRAPLAAGK